MSEGKMRCCGSSLFLKTRFGAGYLLSIAKTRCEVPVAPIEQRIVEVVAEAKVKSAVAGEVIFHLPIHSLDRFPALFAMLKDAGTELGIGSYGVSITTLESVFIALAKEARLVDEECEVAEELSPSTGRWLSRACALLTRGGRTPLPTSDGIQLPEYKGSRKGSNSHHSVKEYSALENGLLLVGTAIAVDAKDEGKVADEYSKEMYVPVVENPLNGIWQPAAVVVATEVLAPWQLLQVQCVELFRKRLVIAGRDLKGLFFQVIFPAIQIMLVLLILTINVNPAGHTLILDATVFPTKGDFRSVVETAGPRHSAVRSQLSADPAARFVEKSADNSTQLSEEMLQDVVKHRFGGYVFGDRVPVRVSVDWQWVRNTLKSFTLEDVSVALDVSDGETTIHFDLANLMGVSRGLPRNTLLRRSLNEVSLPLNSSVGDRFFRELLNSSSSVGNMNMTASFYAREVRFDLVTEEFCLSEVDISVRSSNTVADLAASYCKDLYCSVLPLFPDGVQVYSTNVYSKYTVMHNSTSPHAVAAYSGVSHPCRVMPC